MHKSINPKINIHVQWNLDLMKCQGTGEIGSLYIYIYIYIEGLLYQKPNVTVVINVCKNNESDCYIGVYVVNRQV